MVLNLLSAFLLVLSLTAFGPVSAQKFRHADNVKSKPDVKFLDDIEVSFSATPTTTVMLEKDTKLPISSSPNSKVRVNSSPDLAADQITALQLKYGVLMNIEVELINNLSLYQAIDEWYGTPYHLGGTSKDGVDCSAFVQSVYNTLYGITIPRTAHEQYQEFSPVNKEDLREGDLVFFNTSGGVSHVGIYLQNNKFVHAAVSEGVMISDLDDNYWSRRYVGATHYNIPAAPAIVLSTPKP